MATPIRFGTEFLVNTTVVSGQSFSTSTALADGRFVVSWTDVSSSGGDPTGFAVRAQVYNADGTKSGTEFLVNSTTAGHQHESAIAGLNDGRFVVTWNDGSASGADATGSSIKAQIFNVNGTPSGVELLINTITTGDQSQPAIAVLSDGRFVVTWTDISLLGGDNSNHGIRAQMFNADGSPLGTEFLVNSVIASSQDQPAITALENGRFVVTWRTANPTGGDGSFTAIKAQVFNANGTPSGVEFLVNTTAANSQFEPAITGLADGRFVIVWRDDSQAAGDTSGDAIRAQVYNVNGSPSGVEFVVNTTTAADQVYPAITALADGRFVMVWQDASQTGGDTSLSAIRGQVFNADGSTSGSEFLVNTLTAFSQSQPAISELADGRLIVTWTDFSQAADDPSAAAVRGQLLDPREGAVNLTGTALADQWFGTGFGDLLAGAGGNDKLQGAGGADQIQGAAGADQLSGDNGNDKLEGGNSNDTLLGGTGQDRLFGDAGADDLRGGLNRDKLTGGAGADDFIFATAAEAGSGANRDQIIDFVHLVDDIDLSAIIVVGGSFIGNAVFGSNPGEVRYTKSSGILRGDVNGDGEADFEIEITNLPVLTAADFIF